MEMGSGSTHLRRGFTLAELLIKDKYLTIPSKSKRAYEHMSIWAVTPKPIDSKPVESSSK